jgi:phosphohistidine phosphatase
MKTLYLCRHAKSAWSDPRQDDFDRPLNERGLRNAPFMARVFHERGEPIDLIVTSPANRAITTARAFANAIALPVDRFIQDRSIHLASRQTLLHLVNRLPESADRVMLFGHNPGFTDLLDHLSDAGVDNLPTCGLARIDLHVKHWQEVMKNCGTMVWFDYPKRHPGQD